MNLKDAFSINISINFSNSAKKRKKKKMQDAYKSFLDGNWRSLNKRGFNRKIRTFGSNG